MQGSAAGRLVRTTIQAINFIDRPSCIWKPAIFALHVVMTTLVGRIRQITQRDILVQSRRSSELLFRSQQNTLMFSSSRCFVTVARLTTTLALLSTRTISSFCIFGGYVKLGQRGRHLSVERTKEERIMTNDASRIVDCAIEAVDPYTAIRKHFSVSGKDKKIRTLEKATIMDNAIEYDLDEIDKIVLVAFGKASSAMATAVVQKLTNKEENLDLPSIEGVVIVKDDHETEEEKAILSSYNITIRSASHPVPDERSASAAAEIMHAVSSTASPRTLVICCISGGGSSLFCKPQSPLTISDLQKTNSVLLESGLSIQDINIIRKRLEEGKGGRLAAAAYPSKVLSLVLSDVLGDPLDLIASGPTVPDTSSWGDAWSLVDKNELQSKMPKSVLQVLQDGIEGKLPNSPSLDHPTFLEKKCSTVVVGNNGLAVNAAAVEAKRLGYNVVVLGTRFEGESKHVANVFAALVHQLSLQRRHLPKNDLSLFTLSALPAALIAGGETTVSIPPSAKDGKGGRNQELALAAAIQFRHLNIRNAVLASVGTDGTDGPTDAAGAVIDGGTTDRLTGSAEDALTRHDSYPYLNQKEPDGHSPLIKTGPTGTNVADVCIILVK